MKKYKYKMISINEVNYYLDLEEIDNLIKITKADSVDMIHQETEVTIVKDADGGEVGSEQRTKLTQNKDEYNASKFGVITMLLDKVLDIGEIDTTLGFERGCKNLAFSEIIAINTLLKTKILKEENE